MTKYPTFVCKYLHYSNSNYATQINQNFYSHYMSPTTADIKNYDVN